MTPTFIAMMLLDGLLLWGIIRTRGWWIPKAAAIVVVLAFNFLLLAAPASFSGWATSRGIPDGSKLIACDVVEPNSIYFWVVPSSKPTVFGYHWIDSEPRSYRLEYTRQLHAQCQAAQKAMARGATVGVVGLSGNGHLRQGGGTHTLYVMPPTLPPKGETP